MPAVVVKPVGVALLKDVTVTAGHLKIPPLKVMFLVPAAVVKDPVVPTTKVLPLRSSVPLVSVKVLALPIVKLSSSLNVPPVPFCVIGISTVRPLVVMV